MSRAACVCWPSRRVSPSPVSSPGHDMVTVCADRLIHVQRVNPGHSERAGRVQRAGEGEETARRALPEGLTLQRQKTKQHIVPSGDRLRNTEQRPSQQTNNVSVRNMDDVSVRSVPPDTGGATRPGHTVANSHLVATKDTAMFFIHGVGGSGEVWRAQIDHFGAAGYEVIAPDLIGHGLSSAPSDPAAYHFTQIADDLLYVFDHYCRRRNVVVGHSYGCSFAAVLARRRQGYVHQLVLVSGGSPTPLAPQPGVFTGPLCVLHCCRHLLEARLARRAFHGGGKTAVKREKTFDIPSYVLKAVMDGQDWLEGDDDYHSHITAPTLLIHGRHDGLVTLDEEHEMEQVIFDSQLEVVEDASHMVMIEQPDTVNRLIHEFLVMNRHSEQTDTRVPGDEQTQ